MLRNKTSVHFITFHRNSSDIALKSGWNCSWLQCEPDKNRSRNRLCNMGLKCPIWVIFVTGSLKRTFALLFCVVFALPRAQAFKRLSRSQKRSVFYASKELRCSMKKKLIQLQPYPNFSFRSIITISVILFLLRFCLWRNFVCNSKQQERCFD